MGKEALAVEAVHHVGEIILERIRENLAQVDDAAASIHSFIRNIALNVERSGFRGGGPITTIAMEMASTSETLRQECERIYSDWQAAFADKLRLGGIDAMRTQRMAALIIAAIEGGVILCRTRQSREPLEQVGDEINDLVKHACKGLFFFVRLM